MPSKPLTFMEWYARGYKKYLAKDLRGATLCYERAVAALGPSGEHPELLALLGNLTQNYLDLDDEDNGWRYFDMCFQRAEEAATAGRGVHPNTWHQLAWILYDRGTPAHAEQALELVQRSINQDPQLIALDTKMRILLKLGREAEARQVAIEALTRDFSHADFQDVKKRFALTTREAVRRAAAPAGAAPRRAAKGWSVPAEAWDDAETESAPPPPPKKTAAKRAAPVDPAKLFAMPPGEPRLRALQQAARKHLNDLFSNKGFSRRIGDLTDTAHILSLLEGPDASPYARLDAALALAVRGDARAVPHLRRVFDATVFARKNSTHEFGYAALGLAVLGDIDSLDRVRRCPRDSIARPLGELALALLTQELMLA